MPGMPASPFKMIKPLAGRALEVALNRALALDPDTRTALASLDGQRIALTLESPSLAMQIGVAGERLTGEAMTHAVFRGAIGAPKTWSISGELAFTSKAPGARPYEHLHLSGCVHPDRICSRQAGSGP